jgi:hypothetical protein
VESVPLKVDSFRHRLAWTLPELLEEVLIFLAVMDSIRASQPAAQEADVKMSHFL